MTTQMYVDPLQKNLGAYFGSFWNWIDVLAILLFVPGAVLRWFFYDGNTPSEAEDLQIAARSLYIFSLLSFMMRLVHCLSLSETIGPKILMLSKMVTSEFLEFKYCKTLVKECKSCKNLSGKKFKHSEITDLAVIAMNIQF